MIKLNAKQFLLAAVMTVAGMKVLADATGSVATAPAPANPVLVGKSAPASAASLPTGATVTTGTAAITTSGQHMTITPNQPKTWINWQSYNVAAGHSVTYNQNAGSLTVNQVVGQNMSTIAGQINVTGGTAVLINENGLVFKDGAKIDGNMVFSTQPLQHASFMAGNTLRFEPSQKMGTIEQSGTFSGCGLTAFVGPRAAFNGDIHAALQVYAGDRISMHFNGDKLMGVDITEQAKAHNIEVNNVTGAHIKITAAMAEQAVEGIINVKGHLQATDMDVDNGTITINGGDVTVEGTAKLTTQGGAIRIGVPESYNSVNSAQRALVNDLLIQPGAELDAGAGNIFLLGVNGKFHGTYTTQGGLIELSARKSVLYRHTANLNGGTLVLDPATLTIVWGTAGDDEVSAQDINTQLQTGSVFLQAEDNITLDDLDPEFEGNQIIWDTDYSLSMKADTITLDGNITYTGGAGSFGRLNLYTTIPGQEVTGDGNLTFIGGSIRTFNTQQAGGVALNGPNVAPPEAIVDQYQVINTRLELEGIRNNFETLDLNYALGNNIDIGDVPNWTPIGSGGGNEFRGKFTGDNLQGGAYEIQNMRINTGENDTANVGLFGATNRATIDHLRVHIAEYSGTGDQRGGLVGAMTLGTLHNVGVIGDLGVSVSGTSKVGGLIGYFASGGGPTLILTNCFSTVNVGAVDRQVGGLIGHMLLINSNTNTISKSYATGNVNAKGISNVGGLIGDLGLSSGAQLTISESFTTGSVSHEGDNINDTGGLIGHINALNTSQLTIENSFSLGKVIGSDNVGGLIGYAVPETDGKITIRNSYSTADVSGNNNVGGSIGFLSNSANITVTDVYSSGAVTPPGDPDDPNIGVVVGNPTITYNVPTDTPGRIAEADLFDAENGVVQLFTGLADTPWAIPSGEQDGIGRVILHLPGTAIPVVPEVDNIITDVVVNNHAVSAVTLNDIPHYFIPPRTAYTVSGFSLRQSDDRTLEKAAATAYQVIDFFLPPTPQPTVTVGDDNDDGINTSDLDEDEDFVVDQNYDATEAGEIAEIGDAIEGLGESDELGDLGTAVTAGDNDDEENAGQGASAGAATVAGPKDGSTALIPGAEGSMAAIGEGVTIPDSSLVSSDDV